MLRCLKAVAFTAWRSLPIAAASDLISLFTKRSLFVGIIYIVVMEGVLANLPFGIRCVTVIYYTRLIAYPRLKFYCFIAARIRKTLLPTPGSSTFRKIRTCWSIRNSLRALPRC